MPGFGFFPLRVALVAGLILVAVASGPSAQQRVGVSSAVNPEATSKPPGGAVRRLVIGQEIVFNERITTEASGQTQLLFLDESSMTVGPNSDLTIDQFVYDPKSGTGKLAMSATRGLLRYVGGKLSKQDDAVTLRTSTATLAVRGGAFIANITADGTTEAVFIYGKGLTITGAAGGSQTVTRPGFYSVTTAGGTPSTPGPTPQGQLAGFTQALDGRSGGTGGATDIPTDSNVANSGVSGTVSGNLDASNQQAGQNQGGTQGNNQGNNQGINQGNNPVGTSTLQSATNQPPTNPPPTNPPPPVTYMVSPSTVSVNENIGNLTFFVTRSPSTAAATVFVSTVQNQGPNNGIIVGLNRQPVSFAAGQSVAQVPVTINDLKLTSGTEGFSLVVLQNAGDPVSAAVATGAFTVVNNDVTPPVMINYAGRVKNTNGGGTARGFVDQTANGDIAYATGTLSIPPGAPQNGVFTATIANNLGTISFPLVPGSASFGPQGTSSNLGTFSGTTFLSADNTFFYANIVPTNAPTQRAFITGGLPVNASALQQTGSTRVFAFSVQPDAALQSNIPFIRAQAGGNLPNATVSPLYVVAPPTTPIGDASTNSAARALQASLAINGQGANQQSAIAVTTGTIDLGFDNHQPPSLDGQLIGSSLQSASGTPVRITSNVASTRDGNGNSLYGANAISGFVLDHSPANGAASEVPLSGTATTYGFAQPAIPVAVPSGVGASRTTQALSGNFGGLMYTTAQPTPYILTGGTFISTDAPNNRIQATLNGAAQSPSSGVNTLGMQFGSLTGIPNTFDAQAFIDDRTFAAETNGIQNINVNGSPGSQGTPHTAYLYLASSGAAGAPASLLPNGASYCQCQFLQWGYWGGDVQTNNPADPNNPRVDRGHINTWVAGVATPLNDLNTLAGQSATGTYTGHAIGSVFNNGQSYVAAGGFTGTYNFGTQTGTLAINNFDGHSFAASGKAPLTAANYSFGFNSPGVKGAINGTFYGPMAAETGGSFAVQTTVGPTYLASGIYAGKK